MNEKEHCPSCDGHGYSIEEETQPGGVHHTWTVGCGTCHGEGWVIREPCIACGAPIITEPGDHVDPDQHDAGCPAVAA